MTIKFTHEYATLNDLSEHILEIAKEKEDQATRSKPTAAKILRGKVMGLQLAASLVRCAIMEKVM